MLGTVARTHTAAPLNMTGARLLNEFATAPLGQELGTIKRSVPKFWKIEAKERMNVQPHARPRTEFDPFACLEFRRTDLDELLIKTQSVAPWSSFGRATMLGLLNADALSAANSYEIDGLFAKSLEAPITLDSALAEFEITLWESFASNVYFVDVDARPLSIPQPGSPLQLIRSELQTWLDASIDDLAVLLDLSPTTLVNATKLGRIARPKTVRKLMVVHGLLRELQRVLGVHAALTWARTSGRRLLADGKLSDFEQYVSTHIFPDALNRRAASPPTFGDHEAELDLVPTSPVGRPSRI